MSSTPPNAARRLTDNRCFVFQAIGPKLAHPFDNFFRLVFAIRRYLAGDDASPGFPGIWRKFAPVGICITPSGDNSNSLGKGFFIDFLRMCLSAHASSV